MEGGLFLPLVIRDLGMDGGREIDNSQKSCLYHKSLTSQNQSAEISRNLHVFYICTYLKAKCEKVVENLIRLLGTCIQHATLVGASPPSAYFPPRIFACVCPLSHVPPIPGTDLLHIRYGQESEQIFLQRQKNRAESGGRICMCGS